MCRYDAGSTESVRIKDAFKSLRSLRHWNKGCATNRMIRKARLAGRQRAAEIPRWKVVVSREFDLESSA